MLRPSYLELMDVITQSDEIDSRVTSRYMVVMATAKRARQLTDGANPTTYAPSDRAVSTAIKEMHEGKLRINVNAGLLDESRARILRQRSAFNSIAAISKDDLSEDLKDDYTSVVYHIEKDSDKDDFLTHDLEEIEEVVGEFDEFEVDDPIVYQDE